MAGLRAPAVLLVVALGVAPVIGFSGPVCVSCCPTAPAAAPRISALACCGDECTERLAAGEDRPALTSARPFAVKSPALTTVVVEVVDRPSLFDAAHPRRLWLPASARPGTVPLRL
jgi:hypothetical protein